MKRFERTALFVAYAVVLGVPFSCAVDACLPPGAIDAIALTLDEAACLARHRADGVPAAILACGIPRAKASQARSLVEGRPVSVQIGDAGP